jgi:putative chitinase
MAKLTQNIIVVGCGATALLAGKWLEPLQVACDEFKIVTANRVGAFLANVGVESGGLVSLVESLYYTDPVRVAKIFRSSMDINNNKVVDEADIEFAKQYIRNSEKMANRVYANRMGNGNEASGDGFRYRGRGAMQTTGRENYAKAGKALGVDLIGNPDLLTRPDVAARSAAYFFQSNGCNEMADGNQISRIVQTINGALPNANNHGPLRLERYHKVRQMLA